MQLLFSARVARMAHVTCLGTLSAMAITALTATAQAQALPEFKPSPDRGFSYFLGLAQQTTTYSERPSEDVLKLRVITANKTKSAMLVSGALYAFNDDLLLSLDNHSTFAPATSMERWRETTGALLQTNRFSLSQSNTRALAYLRARNDLFYIGGINFRSQSFKRFDFQSNDSRIDVTDLVPTEESTSEVVAEIGLAFEGERVKRSDRHYGFRLSVGTPLWRQTTNTGYPGLIFSNRQGWDANLEGRYSWALNDIAHIGLWGKYTFSERAAESLGYTDSRTQEARVAELPRSHLRSTTLGVELLWKL
ncbi:MAG: hypothetical protein RI920_1916 [Pseudomonadota bacterium]|jgi:hypothetical protein